MMFDKELLEQATDAAGIDFKVTQEKRQDGSVYYDWNPLTNDGDALRLAVRLGIDSVIFIDAVGNGYTECYAGFNGTFREFHNDDPYAATRRAIVRAAAEIGRNGSC